ncbi:hypothetical protein [Pseudonocardia asaccharolytica]|uniref:Uncharacterized protein n=1 Tax=Pseudonocardia asaccharolytica DSM 44247 = NBRC 16224 TaxID=1123024 RepID=A0A511D918_9PSEU|nr:hypothetical protein [Pseudonocardia asaccharolytica]GEL20144.1 hypothetical protein PA7_39810 [Pseudonocardia asaccharolytica DSM 44247 = NBRC 16224]
MTVAHAPSRLTTCRGECRAAARYPEHHDLLLSVDTDIDALLALIELAVTWHELDYSDCPVVGPADWAGFAAAHGWTFPERAERAFSLALDIVGRRLVGPPPEPAGPGLATVIDLVRG